MKKGLSLILAIAMVFSMFASVAFAAETPVDAGKYLQELKVIKGDANGDLMADAEWNRQDVAVLLSRLLGVEATASATAKAHTYADVNDKFYDGYLSWALANKYMQGNSATDFGFNKPITNQEFAAVVLRALGVDTTGDNYAKTMELAVEKGIIAAGASADANAKRGETYTVIVKALNVEVGTTGKKLGEVLGLEGFKPVVAAVEAKAVGAKKIQVSFSAAVDTAKVSIGVKNNGNTVNVKSTTPAEDKKSVTLEFANVLPAGDYTLEVAGVADKAVTATVKVEAEKVAKVEFTSDKLVIDRANPKKASVTYKVLNQYNEDLTKTESVSVTTSLGTPDVTVDANNRYLVTGGTVTIVSTEDLTKLAVNTPVMFTALHISSSQFASTTATLASASRVSTVDVVKLEAKDNKTIQKGGTASDFKLLLDLKDQYGRSVTNVTYFSDDVAVSVAGNSVTLGAATVTDSKVYLPVATIPNGGKTIVTLVSLTTGNRDQFEIDVKDEVKLDTLTLTAPAQAPIGEKVEVAFNAVDQFGNAIKNPSAMINLSVSSGTYEWTTNLVTDTTTLKIDLTGVTSKGTVVVTGVTQTQKFVNLQFNTIDKAVPTVISNVKNVNALLKGATKTIAAADVVVKDQYGRDIALPSNYAVKVTAVGTDGAVTKDASEDLSAVYTAAKKGATQVTLALTKTVDGTTTVVNNSHYSFDIKVVEKADIASYEAAVDGIILAGGSASYAKDLKVTGLLADGSKVSVFDDVYHSNYTVAAPANVSVASSKVSVAAGFFTDDNKDGEATLIVNVIGDKTTQVIPVTIKTSNKASAVEKLEVVKNTNVELVDANYIAVAQSVVNAGINAVVAEAVKAVDQYGVELTGATEPTYTVYTSNFNADRTVGSLLQKDSFNVTVVAGGKYVSFKVFVK